MLTRRHLHSLALLAAFSACGAGCDLLSGEATTIYVVRHTEKQKIEGEADPPLTEQGSKRALALVLLIDTAELKAVYTTDYKRTRDTALPCAKAAGITLAVVGPKDGDKLVEQLKAQKGGAALVIGHSNTVPEIIKALGVSEPVTLEHGDYGDLFVVTLKGSKATLERRRFGD